MRKASIYMVALSGLVLLAGWSMGYAEPVILPSEVRYHYFASLATGYESFWNNPAGLGADRTIRVAVAGDFRNDDFFEDWGAAVFGDGLGISHRSLKSFRGKEYTEYIFAGGAELGMGLCWGLSYLYIPEGADYYNRRHLWNLGIRFNRNSQYSFGAVFGNLNRGRINGERSSVSHRYALSYFPFNEKMALSIEVSMPEGRFSEADYTYGLCLRPAPGVEIYSAVDSHKNFQIGLKLSLDRYFTVARSHFNSGDYLSTNSVLGFSPIDERGGSRGKIPSITDRPRQPRE